MPSSRHWVQNAPLRLLVLGMPCAFTRNVLSAAITRNQDERVFDLQTIVLAGEKDAAQPGCTDAGWPAAVPVETVPGRTAFMDRGFQDRIAALTPDVIVVACFPWRVPQAIRAMPRFGCLNVHPSLLPDGRGPEPVFWAFRRGLRETGVTIHRMDGGLDTGPILAQQAVEIGAGATISTLEADLARIGGQMLHALLRDLGHGVARECAQPSGTWPGALFPSRHDLIATTGWSATHVASFIEAVAPVYGPVPILIAATGRVLPECVAPGGVIAADDRAAQAEPLAWDDDTLRIRCAPGVVTVRMPRPSSPLVLHRPDGFR